MLIAICRSIDAAGLFVVFSMAINLEPLLKQMHWRALKWTELLHITTDLVRLQIMRNFNIL